MTIPYPTWTRHGFTIRDKEHSSMSMGKLCMEELYSDIVLISEEGVCHPAHRAFLAARSEYFSKLLYGGLKETTEKEVKMMCSDEILQTVLQFLYSGEVKLSRDCNVDYLVALLNEVRLMCISNFKDALEDLIVDHFLKKRNAMVDHATRKDVIEILNVAVKKDFSRIKGDALMLLEPCIDEILKCPDLLNMFSSLGLKSLLRSDDLDLPEIEIFRGIVKWMENNINSEKGNIINSEEKESLLEVRLDQVTTKQLTMEVWPSGLFTDNEILLAIKDQQENNVHSRKVIPDQNICLLSMGAKVIKAMKTENSDSINVIFDGKTNTNDYNWRRGYAMTQLGERLEVELPSKQKINKIRMLLYDRDFMKLVNGSYLYEAHWDYSYRIESSMDKVKWEVIADFSDYKGKSWQTIYFPEKRMKYIGIVGIDEHIVFTGKRYSGATSGYIHVVAIEAMLDTNTRDKDRKNSGMVKR